ncbi:hypothetical protein KSF73_11720 [Burkholderiaceae bacterium DAT-1]|nr:hypothetical protein [Burkholderiaceae bacterium DAT-1]
MKPRVVLCLLALAGLAPAWALETTISGFANVTAGRVMGGSATDQYPAGTEAPFTYQPNSDNGAVKYQCPCFVGNFEYAGMYQYHEWTFSPESSFGLQAQFKVDPQLTATVQMVARGANGYKGDIDWAYLGYELNGHWTVQAGHKRLPIYNYSDYMYVGYAYPWVRPSADLYGWQVYSYNGVNAMYKDVMGDWAITGNVWAGEQHDTDNRELGLIYYGKTIDEKWKNIVGGYLDISNDVYDFRAITMHNTVERYATFGGVTELKVNNVAQSFYGLAFNVDTDSFIWRSEANYFTRPSVKDNYMSYLFSAGYHFTPEWSGYVSWSRFKERFANDVSEIHVTTSATARWDFRKGQALKLQYDHLDDRSQYGFTGNANMLSMSWNVVF